MEQIYSLVFSTDYLTLKIILGFIVVAYLIKERYDESSFNRPTEIPRAPDDHSAQVSRDIPEYEERSQDSTLPSQTQKPNAQDAILSLIGLKISNKFEVVITEPMLEKLKNTDPGSFFQNKAMLQIFPRQLISSVVEKALSGELRAGDKIKFRNGEVLIEKSINN